MGQLIDKTVLRKELSKLPSEMGFVRKSDVMQILGSQKCAYDVDKVVEQLKCNDCEKCPFLRLVQEVNIVKIVTIR